MIRRLGIRHKLKQGRSVVELLYDKSKYIQR
jgi:hypothetical protein